MYVLGSPQTMYVEHSMRTEQVARGRRGTPRRPRRRLLRRWGAGRARTAPVAPAC